MKTQENNKNWKDAYPATPEMCREAVLHAVSTYREEEKEKRIMKKPLAILAFAVLMVVLSVGTAVALVNAYSVRDSVAGGEPSREFEDRIQELTGEMTFDGVTLSMGDAVFDGTYLFFTLNAEAEDGAEMYLLPELRAFCGGEERVVDYGVLNLGYSDGVLYSPRLEYSIPAEWNARAELYGERAKETVEWRFTVRAFRPLWPIVSMERYGELPGDCMENRVIAVDEMFGLPDLSYFIQELSAALDAETDWSPQIAAELLIRSGAFEAAGEQEIIFATPVSQPAAYQADQLIPYLNDGVHDDSGYDIQFTALETTFMRFRYEMDVTLASDGAFSGFTAPLWFAMYDQNGRELEAETGPHMDLSADRKTIHAWNEGQYISDEPLTSVTFVPFRTAYILNGEYIREGGDFSKAFTVILEKE